MNEEGQKGPRADKTGDAAAGNLRDQMFGADRKVQRKRRKVSYLTLNKIERVDYKDIAILRRFINDRGKILPSRQTGATAGQQRMITRAILRAREMALLPFAVNEMGSDRRESGPRRERQPRGDYHAQQRNDAEASVAAAAAAPVAEAPAEQTS
jgi:small subunit ribosomal protein S18